MKPAVSTAGSLIVSQNYFCIFIKIKIKTMVRELTNEEKLLIASKVEEFLNREVWNWELITEDEETWDGEEMCLEEKVIREIIDNLQSRIDYY